ALTSSTQKIACGLPMLTTEGECRIGAPGGPASSSIARVSGNGRASGISFQAKRGAPMSTVQVDGASAFQQASKPASVSKVSVSLPLSFDTRSATQRMPLPQAPACEPSLL